MNDLWKRRMWMAWQPALIYYSLPGVNLCGEVEGQEI